MGAKRKITEKDIRAIKESLLCKVEELSIKLAPVYNILNWTWGTSGIPTESDIAEVLKERIDNLSTTTCGSSTCGLSAYWEIEEGGILDAGIMFSINESEWF
jgi:hypothetical protein